MLFRMLFVRLGSGDKTGGRTFWPLLTQLITQESRTMGTGWHALFDFSGGIK